MTIPSAPRDQNYVPVLMATSHDDGVTPVLLWADPVTHRLLVDLPAGSGTVTSVSVVTGNGFAGSVANATTTPAITITTSITGVLKGNGTAISAATAGTDYTTPTGTEALSNKTIGNTNTVTLKQSLFTLQDATDTTKLAVFALSAIATGTTRTITVPDASGTLTLLGNASTGSGSVVLAASPALSGTPTAPTATAGDSSTTIATTAFVANAVLGQNFKEAAKYASTAALPSIIYANGSSGVGATLTGVALGAISIDSSSPAVNDRILIKNQVSTFQNGIYTVTATGSGAAVFVLTRVVDADQANEYKTGDSIFITAGSTLSTTTWAYTGSDSPVIGTDAISFVQTAGQGSFTNGNGITITGVSIAIDTSVTVDKTTSQTLTNKTLTTPIIASVSNSGTITIPTGTDTLVARATTDTFTNKRITKRTGTTTSSATPTINTDNVDFYSLTAQTADITSFTTNLSGTPTENQTLWIAITGTAARAITWGNSFEASTVALPTTTVTTARLDVGFVWNTVTSKWRCVASA